MQDVESIEGKTTESSGTAVVTFQLLYRTSKIFGVNLSASFDATSRVAVLKPGTETGEMFSIDLALGLISCVINRIS